MSTTFRLSTDNQDSEWLGFLILLMDGDQGGWKGGETHGIVSAIHIEYSPTAFCVLGQDGANYKDPPPLANAHVPKVTCCIL